MSMATGGGMSGLTLSEGHRFSVPGWKWLPPKTVAIVFRKGPWLVISIDGEQQPQVVHVDDTNDWVPANPEPK